MIILTPADAGGCERYGGGDSLIGSLVWTTSGAWAWKFAVRSFSPLNECVKESKEVSS